MAVRRPVKLATSSAGATDFQELTDAEITAIQDYCRYLWAANPSVTLTYDTATPTADWLANMADTRLQAGAYSTRVGDGTSGDDGALEYPPETTTAEPTTVTVNYRRIKQTVDSVTDLTDTNNIRFPLYVATGAAAGTDLQAMSLTDMYDTFVFPAIDTLAAAGQPGIYTIHTATTLTGYTAVSTNPIFVDTQADTSLYTAAGIPEALDQPKTITSYYLLKKDNIAAPTVVMDNMLYANTTSSTDMDIKQYTTAGLAADLEVLMRYAISATTSYRLRYSITTGATGTQLGTGMVDTKLNGSGAYTTYFAGVDDYRAQEFPNGTPVTINTYTLRLTQS